MEAYAKITFYDGKFREEELHLKGVMVGKIDTRLYGVFKIKTKSHIVDLEKYLLARVEEQFGLPIQSEKDVVCFLDYLQKNHEKTFKQWFEEYMKNKLLEVGYDYDKRVEEFERTAMKGNKT